MAQDVFAEQEALRRRRALLDAMQAQNMGTQIQGNTGLGQALAQLGTAYVLKNKQGSVDNESAINRDRYGTELSGALEKYLATREGTPGRGANEMDNDMVPGTPGNPRKAILEAMTSRFPELQAMGKAEFAQLGKRPGYKDHVVNNRIIRVPEEGGAPKELGQFEDKYGPIEQKQTADGRVIEMQQNLSTGKWEPVDKGTKVSVNTTVDNVGNKEALKATGDVLKSAREQQISAADMRRSGEQLMKLSQDPDVVTGFGAGPLGMLQSAGVKLGFAEPEAAAKTQVLVSSLANRTLEAARALKGPTSDKDIIFLEKAAAGQISYDPKAIEHLAGLAVAYAHNTMLDARDQWESAATVEGAQEIKKLHPQPTFGTWGNYGPAFQQGENGRVYYQGIVPQQPTAGTKPSASPQGPRKLDGRIKFGS